MKKRYFISLIFALFLSGNISASAVTATPFVAQDKLDGYNRSFFKHWIDANKNGCDTRAEVLIAEAVVKPKMDKKCKLTGGKWVSVYDGKTLTDASKLDVDHLVPLAEAWRSGAWAWTAKQRQDYANDLSDSRALIAVTLTTNRSKSDKDIGEWVPKLDTCTYIKNWVAIKIRYSLTYDDKEAAALASYSQTCPIGELKVEILAGYQYQSESETPSSTPTQSTDESVCTLGVQARVSVSTEDKATLTQLENSLIEYLKLNTKYSNSINTGIEKIKETKSLSRFVCKGKRADLAQVAVEDTVALQVKSLITAIMSLISNIQKEASATPVATSAPTVSPTPTPTPKVSITPTQTKAPAIKYKNCTEAKAAGVTPLRKATNPELYEMNSGLDRDKDGVACE
jgi:hypothetical protein